MTGARACALGLTASLMVGLAGASDAQSLGEIARKEAERRGARPATGKVYSNENLEPDPTSPPPSPAVPAPAPVSPAPAEAAGDGTAPAGAPAEAAQPADTEGVTPLDEQEPQRANDKREDYWRGRSQLIRARLAAQNRQIDALRLRISSFAPGAAAPERDVAERALAKALGDQRFLQDEWDRFERTARERGVPDAWIRQ